MLITDLGLSSPAKPARVVEEPGSRTRAEISSRDGEVLVACSLVFGYEDTDLLRSHLPWAHSCYQ